jgi:hypothetical protein
MDNLTYIFDQPDSLDFFNHANPNELFSSSYFSFSATLASSDNFHTHSETVKTKILADHLQTYNTFAEGICVNIIITPNYFQHFRFAHVNAFLMYDFVAMAHGILNMVKVNLEDIELAHDSTNKPLISKINVVILGLCTIQNILTGEAIGLNERCHLFPLLATKLAIIQYAFELVVRSNVLDEESSPSPFRKDNYIRVINLTPDKLKNLLNFTTQQPGNKIVAPEYNDDNYYCQSTADLVTSMPFPMEQNITVTDLSTILVNVFAKQTHITLCNQSVLPNTAFFVNFYNPASGTVQEVWGSLLQKLEQQKHTVGIALLAFYIAVRFYLDRISEQKPQIEKDVDNLANQNDLLRAWYHQYDEIKKSKGIQPGFEGVAFNQVAEMAFQGDAFMNLAFAKQMVAACLNSIEKIQNSAQYRPKENNCSMM